MNSCLYECTVMHHRLEPKVHRFSYRIFMFYLDLDEVATVASRRPWFGGGRFNLYSFRARDHLHLGEKSLKENIVRYLAGQGIAFPEKGKIQLLTLPRVFGYVFNPVSFYFCFDAVGSPLCAIAEVGNTFGEMKPYLLPAPDAAGRFRLVAPKHFYVSPFSALDVAFDFKLQAPGGTLEIHIDDRVADRRILLTALTGRRAPLTAPRLAWFTLKYPLLTLRVIFLIHWHALRLWGKRLPYFAKAARPELQRAVLNPHASIAPRLHESGTNA